MTALRRRGPAEESAMSELESVVTPVAAGPRERLLERIAGVLACPDCRSPLDPPAVGDGSVEPVIASSGATTRSATSMSGCPSSKPSSMMATRTERSPSVKSHASVAAMSAPTVPPPDPSLRRCHWYWKRPSLGSAANSRRRWKRGSA